MTCLFCRKIYNSEDLNKPTGSSHIEYNEKDRKFNIYAGNQEWYWYGVMRDVKFCPYCGRKLEYVVDN